jgi:hypothetical protein
MATRAATLVPWALALLGIEYGVALLLPHGWLESLAPLYGGGLLVVAELAYWSLAPTAGAWGERAVVVRRVGAICLLAASSSAAGAVVLAAASREVRGGVALFALGFAASAAVLVGTAILARRGPPA